MVKAVCWNGSAREVASKVGRTQRGRGLQSCTVGKVWPPIVATWWALRQRGLAMSWARKWLAPGTISVRSPAGSAQLRSDSMAIVTAWDQASTLRSRVLGDTSDGANCLRAVTTSHIESPHRPLSSRRRATSATACWPRSDWSRASRYTVVLRQSESAACGGRTEANHRIHASFIEQTPCCVAPAGTTGSRGIGVANGHGVLGRAAALWRFSTGSEDRRTAVRAGPAGNVRQEIGRAHVITHV